LLCPRKVMSSARKSKPFSTLPRCPHPPFFPIVLSLDTDVDRRALRFPLRTKKLAMITKPFDTARLGNVRIEHGVYFSCVCV
jgi:hypothetical protein